MKFVLSRAAELDLARILDWTLESFGEEAEVRYEDLIGQAILDIADNPELPGSRARSDLFPGARLYPIALSRQRGGSSSGQVRKPRHLILYRERPTQGVVEIARILHDRMEPDRHTRGFE